MFVPFQAAVKCQKQLLLSFAYHSSAVYTQDNPSLNTRALPEAKRLQEKSSFHIRNSLSGQTCYVTQGKSLKIHEHAIAKRRNLSS